LITALLLCITTAAAQDFQIRSRVDLVVVPVTVKGDDDRVITGLTKDDFLIYEDGKPQTITNFTSEPVPLSAAVLVDTGLSAESLTKVQETFPALAGAFAESDEVAVYRFEKYVFQVQDFSTDLLAVETALKKLKDIEPSSSAYPNAPGGPFSVPVPMINGAPVVPPGQIGIPPQPRDYPKVLHDAIFAAAADLAKREVERRKIVLVISDGRTTGSDHSYDDTVRRLLEAGIQVYAIGMDLGFLNRRFSVLEDYAKTTGGDTYFSNSVSTLERFYTLSASQARNQYVLGYVSSNRVPGRVAVYRDIDVKIARADGLETLHRAGYYQYPMP
jgi:VWFA-related protein